MKIIFYGSMLLFWSAFSDASIVEKMGGAARHRFRFMTFNLWYYGSKVDDGLEKAAAHINAVKPDVVALQEMQQVHLDKLLSILPRGVWNQCNATAEGAGDNLPFIISKYKIQKSYQTLYGFRHVACKLLLDSDDPELYLNVWNLHLQPEPYGPYTACFGCSNPNNGCINNSETLKERLLNGEYDAKDTKADKRVNSIQRLCADGQFDANLRNSDVEPLIVSGDFNVPSHLDWIEKTKKLHCNISFEWPVTKIFESKGLIDSFRELHPDPLSSPGNTWTAVHSRNPESKDQRDEPQDRIDFILYKGKSMKAKNSFIYKGEKEIAEYPNHGSNDWPSDHYAVITDFEIY